VPEALRELRLQNSMRSEHVSTRPSGLPGPYGHDTLIDIATPGRSSASRAKISRASQVFFDWLCSRQPSRYTAGWVSFSADAQQEPSVMRAIIDAGVLTISLGFLAVCVAFINSYVPGDGRMYRMPISHLIKARPPSFRRKLKFACLLMAIGCVVVMYVICKRGKFADVADVSTPVEFWLVTTYWVLLCVVSGYLYLRRSKELPGSVGSEPR